MLLPQISIPSHSVQSSPVFHLPLFTMGYGAQVYDMIAQRFCPYCKGSRTLEPRQQWEEWFVFPGWALA